MCLCSRPLAPSMKHKINIKVSGSYYKKFLFFTIIVIQELKEISNESMIERRMRKNDKRTWSWSWSRKRRESGVFIERENWREREDSCFFPFFPSKSFPRKNISFPLYFDSFATPALRVSELFTLESSSVQLLP